MHVDGFRFDLASILGRGRDGEVLPNPPLIEAIAADPVLADIKLIAEAWDAAGLYQVGSFPNWGRWAEWNGRFRDEVRRFVKSDGGMTRRWRSASSGSPDLYRGSARAPWHSINFITSHDGFTLADLVTYNDKHNWANGEGNSDGHADNLSWNCGEEGPARPGGARAARAAAAQLPGAAAALAGRADAAGRRRVRAHPGRQQQRLLPGQRDLLARLVAAGAQPRPVPLHRAADPLPQGASVAAPPHLLRGREAAAARLARREARQAGLGRPVATLGMHLTGADGDEPIYIFTNAHWEPCVSSCPSCRPGGAGGVSSTPASPPARTPRAGGRGAVAVRRRRTWPARARSWSSSRDDCPWRPASDLVLLPYGGWRSGDVTGCPTIGAWCGPAAAGAASGVAGFLVWPRLASAGAWRWR